MKIKYESTKRKKDIARSKIAYQKYAKSIDEPIELQIYEELHRFFHKENYPVAGAIQDATSLYYAFQSIYNLAAKYKYYIDNDINTTFQYYRMGAIYYAMAYQEMQQACQVDEIVMDYMNDIETHEKFLYQAISVGEWELARENSTSCPVIQAMLYENYAKAKELLLMDTEEPNESQEAYFIHLPYLKKIYLAMLNGDEHAWNEQLAKRINQYRKRPSDYQPVVDFVSISLIKMAQKLNLQYQFKVEEIPEYFFESIHIIERMDCKIIDLKKCEVAFQKWGKQTPTLEEIRALLQMLG